MEKNILTKKKRNRLIKIIEFLKYEIENNLNRCGGNFCYIDKLEEILYKGYYNEYERKTMYNLDKIYVYVSKTGETYFTQST